MIYTFKFCPTEGIESAQVWKGEDRRGNDCLGEDVGNSLIVVTAHNVFRVFNGSMENYDVYDDRYLKLDLPDDDAAESLAVAINELGLDPWRVDWVSRDGNDEVYID